MNKVSTGKVQIGKAYVPPPMPIRSQDAIHLQIALLDKRTATPAPLLRRVIAPIVRWL